MPDRLALPEDRREACRACGSEKREWLAECEDCQKIICSECSVLTTEEDWRPFELCRCCAIARLDQALTDLLPDKCTCEWPAWSRYGQQLPLEAA